MPKQERRILIVGAGALGTLFAARFARAGIHVTMLDEWKAARDELNTKGARLIDETGTEETHRVQAVKKCKDADIALVLVKSWQTKEAARQLAECLSPRGVAITLQNGLGNGKILSSVLGAERVAQGITTIGASLLEPGMARAGGEGRVSLEAHPRLDGFATLLTEAGFQTEVVPSAASLIWSKLVINAAINPLTALLNIPNGELLNRSSARELMGELATETASVAAAQGIRLAFDDPIKAVEKVARDTASNHSSMLQDLRRGAPTEIDFICGAVTRAGEARGVGVAANRVCWQLVRAAAGRGKI